MHLYMCEYMHMCVSMLFSDQRLTSNSPRALSLNFSIKDIDCWTNLWF